MKGKYTFCHSTSQSYFHIFPVFLSSLYDETPTGIFPRQFPFSSSLRISLSVNSSIASIHCRVSLTASSITAVSHHRKNTSQYHLPCPSHLAFLVSSLLFLPSLSYPSFAVFIYSFNLFVCFFLFFFCFVVLSCPNFPF